MIRKTFTFFLVGSVFFIFVSFGLGISPKKSSADTISDIKKNIEVKNVQIENLNKEIKQLGEQIQVVNSEGKSLQGAIKVLDVSASKLGKELQVTQSKIGTTALTLAELGIEIGKNEAVIEKNIDAIINTLKNIQRTDDVSVIESVLNNNNIAILWDDLESLERFQLAVKESTDILKEQKKQMEERRAETEQKKKTLVELNNELADKKKVIDINKNEKSTLLSVTKNKETNYRKILDEKKRLSEAFEQELAQYENQLKLIIDPKSYPSPGKGVLTWPLNDIFITQYFGNTEFSKTAAYSGKGHNGIDFRATRGTPVKAAGSGIVEDTGNTSLVPGCYSYGKWILLRHNSGLTTLYAHLDLIKVNKGESVSLGDIIGYSGSTGYSTGPHLHFGVYATQGIRVVTFTRGQSINCTGARVPVADTKAYLNPLVYL